MIKLNDIQRNKCLQIFELTLIRTDRIISTYVFTVFYIKSDVSLQVHPSIFKNANSHRELSISCLYTNIFVFKYCRCLHMKRPIIGDIAFCIFKYNWHSSTFVITLSLTGDIRPDMAHYSASLLSTIHSVSLFLLQCREIHFH